MVQRARVVLLAADGRSNRARFIAAYDAHRRPVQIRLQRHAPKAGSPTHALFGYAPPASRR